MAEKTCSNCVHVDVCENRFSWLDQEDNAKHIICHHFKDKADVVEVVRCKDCVNWVDGYAGCTDNIKLCKCGQYFVGKQGYCLYGERKEQTT